jgi:amino acid adenylation domain-containing protein
MASTNDTLSRRRSELASRRGALSDVKQQELERLLNRSTVEEIAARVISPRPADQPAPLSFAQERLWFLHQLDPESTAYNVAIPLRITGRLNVAALSQSLSEAVRRHESLRTTFAAVDGKPVQVAGLARNLEVPLVDLTLLPESQRKDMVRRLVHEGGRRRFNLAEGPLFQPTAFRVAEDEHVLLVLMQHIIVDEWSKHLLVREVGEVYRAFEQGDASTLPELPIQYADYAYWHRDSLRDEVLEQELSYWREQLDGSPEMLNLPVDRPRPPVMTYAGDAVPFVVPQALTEKLNELTRSSGTSLFMTLLASFQMLLARYTGQDDVVVATPVAGRRSLETEDLIGFFVNTLLIRTTFSGNPRLREAIARVRQVVLEAQTHQDLPFEKLVEELHPERSLSHGPLFEVMFVFTSKPRTSVEVQEISISLLELNSGTEKFGITFEVSENVHELNCLVSYRTDLFDRSTIERFCRHWQRLLEAMVAEPDELLSSVELLNDDEQTQVLEQWNDTAVNWPDASFLSLFEKQVERTPEAAAVQFGDTYLSYDQLNARANQLAHHLQRLGAGADTRVGICLEPSLEMVTAVLGVVKAGAAYVPLDPAYPAERLNLMLANARCLALLTNEKLAPSLPETDAQLLLLDREWPQIADESSANPRIQIEPDTLVNVIYTSGSTGVPKGVAMTHRALSNLVCWQTREFPEPARTLQFASLSFDVSFQEIMTTWCSGGTLVLVTNEQRHDVNRMLAFLNAEQVERIDLPFVYLQHLAESVEQGQAAPLSLRDLIAAGEQLECTPQIRQLCERLQCGLYNHYGPSETHVVTEHELRVPADEWPTLAPIGKPIANAKIYILDRGLQPTPIGVAGELFIGGANVSRGYLERPDLTAERYVPNPFDNGSGERLYRSGDLARYRAGGTIEFLGRIDTQVKVRGFRIELGEIEATLRKHANVLHAIVMVHQESARNKRLVAYVVGRGGVAPNINELKTWLKERLPAYMAPSDWIALDELPRTPSGKIDRAALPKPDSDRAVESATFSAPQTLIEELLAAIWQQVLNLERVSRDDNFFWLGGHSLLATRITSRIRDTFHVELPVRVLFESPTIVELAARIEQLTQAGATLEAPPLERRPTDEPLILSHAQERLWFLDQLTPGSNAYNLPVAMHISADLNVLAFQQALGEVVRRHEVLRTTIQIVDGHPRPAIGIRDSIKLSFVDLRSLGGAEQEAQAARLRDDDALRPFDLKNGTLLRMTLIRFSTDRYLLLTNMHHIVSDGWSMEVLLHEMESLYLTFANGTPSSLPELEIQYADYAGWQREWLQGDVLAAQVDYWKRELEGAPTLLDLQPDHAPVATRTGLAANCPIVFSPELSRALREFSRREGSTLFMTLMAGFHALLRRYTDQKNILVGTPIAGRSRAELEPLIGFFVNMVALRTNFEADPSFRDLLKQVREGALGAYAHQDVPFERLVEELQPERAIGRNPIFQVVFALQNVEQPTMQMEGVSAPVAVPASPETKFDLELYLQDAPNGLRGTLVYSVDLFERAFIEGMVRRFERLLEKVLVEPAAPLPGLSLLDKHEYRQIVEEWNHTTVALPEICIHQLFEQQVAQHPDAIAVEFQDEQLTYRDLNARANRLAEALRAEAVGPEVFVGVMLERSAELIVALLGIAKAGGVYVPINLNDPPKRIEFILADAGVKALVTTKRLSATIPGKDLTLIYLDDEREVLGKTDLSTDVTTHNLAYLMYTSGSTGTPKAVGITHRNILRLVREANYAELNSDHVFLQFAPVSFDASTFEIWGALLNGARLVVFPPYLPSLAELANFVNQTQVTTLWLTGGLFHQLVDGDVAKLTTLKQLLAGGEALSPVHVNKALAQLNGCRLINGYGPTETTTFACCYRITPDFPGPSVPIGRPISNTTAYVLNAMQPVGVGERGELFIGGEGLGRGYHQRPDLTAERFVPDPYADRPGRRLYRTGDAARYLDQGLIRFLGRVDEQIKLSGFRIEPGEIETVLSEHPSVSKALVMAKEAMSGDRRLVAYFVSNGGPETTSEELKRYLQERLPGFMVPTVWIRLDELPLTPNGKVDRAALPDPDRAYLESPASFQAPRTQTEEILAGIWERVLGVERIGRDDDFFSLGGYSLLATRIISRIRESFRIELRVRSIFEWPVLAELAERIEEAMRAGSVLVAPPLERVTTLEQLPLSYAQQRLWFLDQLIPNNTAYNIPIAFRLRGALNVEALEQSLNETVKRHESLRTNFIEVDGQPIQVIAPARNQDLSIVDVTELVSEEREAVVQQLALAEGQRPFNLASDPLFRTILFRLAADEYVLLAVMHHIISDGWSMDVLLRDVPRVYTALNRGRPSALPELPIQYADFARWQRDWLQGDVLEQELSYWRDQLADIPSELSLPTDRPRPSALSMKGSAVLLEVPQTLTAKLRALSQAEGSTLFITLLASFQMLLARYSGQDDIPVGTPIAGRRWVETEDLIGFFVNTLVMRTRLHGNPSIREVLRRVREVTLEAQTHQDVPFEKLVEELRPERTLSHGPLFQTMFVFQNDPRTEPVEQGLAFSSFELNYGAEKNDLTLQVIEQPQRLVASLGYSTDLLDESTIRRMTAHWQRILEAIADDPEQSLEEMELLSTAERQQMVTEWNATDREFPRHVCVQELFARQAQLTPDAAAVSFEDEQLTYAGLQRRANQLAHYLRNVGVGPDTTVAIYLERSVDMIVALLGVLKAGGAYLPLETTQPKARVQYVLNDANARVVLAHKRTAAMLPELAATVICLDSDAASIAAESEESPVTNTTPDNLAYVIYTSGSTGGARGVMVQHRSLVNLATSLHEKVYPRDERPLRVSVNAPLMFDSSVKQLVQLIYGHELCVIPEEVRIDGNALADYLERHEIDVLDCTPSQLQLLLPTGIFSADSKAPSLVLIGGEAIDEETWQTLAASTHTTFLNVYGPTECTVDTTVQRIDAGSTEVLIGRPLDNVQTYLLDANDRPVPLGVSGELLIGGAGVARGYLAQPDLTAAKFVPDPFSGKAGGRLYRSGDRVRYRPAGEIAFLGRLDHQVKIRGHRIERGEIEAALRKDPLVREAVVVDREENGDKRLIAYIVPQEQATLSLSELQRGLREQLPDYMMPAGWVLLDQIPLTPNGKVDRAALPKPASTRSETGQGFVAPPTLIQEALAAIWRQVLNLDRVNTGDNFFWLGGHSLLATRIISRIRETFQVELPVRSLFESPTVLEMSQRIESAMRSGSSIAPPPIKALPEGDQLPLSYAQQRLWFLNQLMPDSNAYNLPAEMVIDAQINAGAFQQALSEVMRRHEALRTTFALAGSQPLQYIHAPAPLELPLVDLRGLKPAAQREIAERLQQESELRPFDLQTGPLVRAKLVRTDEQEYLFLLNMHHIVSDGWSMGVLLHEIETLYDSFSRGVPSPLPELEVQYADYASWQRDWLDGETLKAEVAFWKQQLDGAPTLLELETDHPRQLMRKLRGAQSPVVFSGEVSRWLRDFHRAEGVTLFMTLMAGFHALLWRYTGQRDILVGTPTAGRSRVELEPMIGFFVNMIPIRTNFTKVPSFRELVNQVRDASLAAYTHQELPFDKLVEELQPRRSPGRNPIFQAILAFQNAAPQISLAKVTLPAGTPTSADVKFDLEVHLRDTPDGVQGWFVYSPELFDPAFISRMVYHFQHLFEKAMAEPDSELSTLSLLDEAEYRQVVEEWNETAAPVPQGCVHEIFEQEVAERPDKIAIESLDEQITYRELNRRANSLARRLQEAGIGPETFVGVMVERSPELIVSLLGIGKAGGVYVPINLSDPPKRIDFILEDAGVKVVVTTKTQAAAFGDRNLTFVCVDDLSQDGAHNVRAKVIPANLAYLMYTSGSTGKPKGVGITHTNIVGFVKAANYAELSSEETFLHLAPISFDASTFEIWAAMLNGARLIIYPPTLPSLSELGELVARTQVTTLFLTTGLFHQFVDTSVSNIGAVRQLLTGGDALSPQLLQKGLEHIENVAIVNCYGPTESTVMACAYPVERDRQMTSVPIGRPLSNTRLYVINSMQPAGVGERGELFIGGHGLGRGYHNRPDLTAERFLPDQFGPQPGGRLYRTGDAARYLNNGLVQFLGRVDDQIKISGFRIEPREIESVLATHPGLTTALVVAREETAGQKFLVGYFVPNSEAGPNSDELRGYLKERLPEYMVPAVYVPLESVPLTAHGKVDRAALPPPQVSLSRGGREYVAPQNDLQQQLADIWEELFKVHPIGITDNFFELGGHSLQMIMLVARVEERLGKRVSTAELFDDPTIEHLAGLIGHGKENFFQSLIVPLRPEGTQPPIFGPHASGGNVWCYKELINHIGEDQPFLGIQPREPENGLVVYHTDVESMASDYVQAIRGFQPEGPYWLAGWSMGGVIAFEMARQLQQQGQEIALLALMDTGLPEAEESEYNWAVLLAVFALDLGLSEEDIRRPAAWVPAPQMVELRNLWGKARKARVIPSEMTLVEFRKLFDIFKIYANTTRRYKPGPFQGHISLLNPAAGLETIFTDDYDSATRRSKHVKIDPVEGWGRLATEGVDVHHIPGNHFSMLYEPNVQVLGEELRKCIAEARARLNGSKQ